MDVDHGFDHEGKYCLMWDTLLKSKTTDEIEQFVRATKLPFIAKGILSEQDAYKCACTALEAS
jgi:isopentenyl diphosphate isomerase/L-lactate dehydrogenase-like FMN-dependent dehydrogenase